MSSGFEKRQSGLVVPKEQPKRKYGPTEIQDEQLRELAKDAMSQLWDAMELSWPSCGIHMPGSRISHELHYQAYRYIGQMILGKDYPEKEQWT